MRLMLVDDHAIVRAGLRMLLESQPDMEIVGECENGHDAMRRALEWKPDVILMDIALPDIPGYDVTRAIKKEMPGVTILALTMHESDEYFFEMLNAGASGYVPKKAAPTELVNAVRVVHGGGGVLVSFAGKNVGQGLFDARGTER